jgi:hypothetical protein
MRADTASHYFSIVITAASEVRPVAHENCTEVSCALTTHSIGPLALAQMSAILELLRAVELGGV